MKNWFGVIVFILFFSLVRLDVLALEETTTKYFGVGATVEEVEQATFTVKTDGEQVGEGFVYSPESNKADGEIRCQLDLQGKGTVYIKMEEIDKQGNLLSEHKTQNLHLTNDWQPYELTAKLSKSSAHLDIFVITSSKQNTEFQFRELRVH
ncbi:hypothetical protein [Ornithinibacillus xuwenensis]|uniref:CBM6 domain-containing protein n=1 Tax=Ornithinibacillus xuwenensis TaxID=3144668 RepID=A0ABU9XGL9_9BACI